MFYTIYKTTNNINGKWYIGYHSTENIDDDYLGSGRDLKKAIKKYGVENFSKEILFVFNSSEEALRKEAELVDEYVVKNKNSYNIKEGGEGGWSHITEMCRSNGEFKAKRYENWSDTVKQMHKDGKIKSWTKHDGFKGKNHSEKSKSLISKNNAMKLNHEVIEERIKQYNDIDKSWGYISKLSKLWNVSHTQVRRFIKQNNL